MRFSNFIHGNPAHAQCAPVSLSSALSLWDVHISHRDLKHWMGAGYFAGVDDRQIAKASRAMGFSCEVIVETRQAARLLVPRLRRQLRAGQPVILLVDDFRHWVVMLALDEGRFVVMDSEARCAFGFWSEQTLLRRSWNVGDGDEPDQRCALLLSAEDGRRPAFRFDRAFRRLCERGSVESLEVMSQTLRQLAGNALEALGPEAGEYDEESLAAVMARYEDTVVCAVDRWVSAEARKASKRKVRSLYRDYRIVAAAMDLRVPRVADHAVLVAELTAIACVFLCFGEL
jgi:hypothetical protein